MGDIFHIEHYSTNAGDYWYLTIAILFVIIGFFYLSYCLRNEKKYSRKTTGFVVECKKVVSTQQNCIYDISYQYMVGNEKYSYTERSEKPRYSGTKVQFKYKSENPKEVIIYEGKTNYIIALGILALGISLITYVLLTHNTQ